MVLTDTGDKENYDTSDFSPESLLNNIQKSEGRRGFVKKRSIYSVARSADEEKRQLYIHTIRQLYAICIENDDDDKINVFGKAIHSQPIVYYMMNKPKGNFCANYDKNHL